MRVIKKTEYESILVSHKTVYPIEMLTQDLNELFTSKEPLKKLKEIVELAESMILAKQGKNKITFFINNKLDVL